MPATQADEERSTGATRPAQALEETRPASQPLAQRLASGLPKRMRVTEKVAARAAAAESSVLTAATGSAESGALSQRIAPAMFHASQPTSETRQPNRT